MGGLMVVKKRFKQQGPVLLLGLVLLIGSLLTACSGGGTQNQTTGGSGASAPATTQGSDTEKSPEKSKLSVGIIPISNLTPLYVAQQLGYFEEQGLTVETTSASGGSQLTAALMGGSLDFAYSNFLSIFQANEQGYAIDIVANQNSAQDTPPDSASLIILNDSAINRPSDLVGKRVAINALRNINHLSVQHYLAENGIDPEKVNFVEVPFPNMGDALINKQIDAAVEVEPFITFLEADGKVKTLAYPFLEVRPGLDIAGFVASNKFVDEHPVTVERFVAALQKANEYLNTHPEEKVKYIAEFTKSKPEVVQELTIDKWSHKVNPESLQTLADLAQKYGLLKDKLEVNEIVHQTALQ